MVFWVSATLVVPERFVAAEQAHWTAVMGGALPAHLGIRPGSGTAMVDVGVHDDQPAPAGPADGWSGEVRRSRVYQVCIDIPGPRFDAEAASWAELSGGYVDVLERRPEFAWLRIPGGPRPLDVLLQRLDRADGPTAAHLDLGTPDREAEVRRHVELGALVVAEEEFWTVLRDPAGLPYCITDRDPETGELT